MVATQRRHGLVTTRLGFHARSNLPTAWACRMPVAASGRSPSALVQEDLGLALAWRTRTSGQVWSSLRACDSARNSSGTTSEGLDNMDAARSGVHHRMLSTSLPSGRTGVPLATSTAQ